MIDTFAKIQLLLGLNEQIGNCDPSLGGNLSFGSFDVATNGRVPLTDELTVLGGLMAGNARRNGIATPLSTGAAIALRYDPARMGSARPLVEVGAAGSLKRMEILRQYDSGAATAAGSGKADGYDLIAYARVGWVNSLTKRDEVAVSVSITGMWQGIDSFQKADTPDNPFPALVQQGTDRLGIASLSGQYTHLFPSVFGKPVEVGLNGAVQHVFEQKSGVVGEVGGLTVAPDRPSITHFQLSGRISVRLTPSVSAAVIVNSALAPDRIGGARRVRLSHTVLNGAEQSAPAECAELIAARLVVDSGSQACLIVSARRRIDPSKAAWARGSAQRLHYSPLQRPIAQRC